MPQNLFVVLDDESAEKFLAIRKKFFLSKTGAAKMAIHNLYLQEVLGQASERIAPEAIQETKEALQQIVKDLKPKRTDEFGKVEVDIDYILDSVVAK